MRYCHLNYNKVFIFSFVIIFISYSTSKIIAENELIQYKIFQLEENDSVILTNISNVSFNKNCSQFCISDRSTSNILVYDTTGKIIHNLYPDYDLSDSLVFKMKFINDTSPLLPIDSMVNNYPEYSRESLRHELKNSFNNAIYFNDSIIYILGIIECFERTSPNKPINRSNVGGCPLTCLIKYNLLTGEIKLSPFKINYLYFGQPYPIAINFKDSSIVIACNGYNYLQKNNKNFIPYILANYGSDGNFIKFVSKLPEDDYITTNIFKKGIILFPNIIFNKKSELIAVYPYSDKVFNLTTGKDIEIKNLLNSNEEFLSSLKVNQSYLDNLKLDSLLAQLKIRFVNIFEKENENYIIVISDKVLNIGIIREYTPDGSLIRESFISIKGELGLLKAIGYSKCENAIIEFRKDNEKGMFAIYKKWD
jgi:hypothetical protein